MDFKVKPLFQELFELIQDESIMPVGNAPADTLAAELTAGGLTPEHTSYVSNFVPIVTSGVKVVFVRIILHLL